MSPLVPKSRTVAAVVATALLLGAHASVCWRLVGGASGIATPYPILRDDHTFNYYAAVQSRSYLKQAASTAGYDPFFMAGHAKSIIFPSSSTLAEVVVFLFGSDRPERAYKLFVVLAAALAPVFFWRAALVWTGRPNVGLLAVALYLIYFWTDWGILHLLHGMVAFMLSAPLALLTLGTMVRYVRSVATPDADESASLVPSVAFRRRLRLACHWLAMTVATAFCCMTHVVSPIVMAPAFVAAFVVRRRAIGRAGWIAALVAAGLVIAFNSFWLVPGLLLLGTKGDSTSGFVNPNVVERLLEPFTVSPPIQATVLLLAPLGLWSWRRTDRLAMTTLAAALAWVWFLSFPAGWIRSLDSLQAGRNTEYLYCWGALPAAICVVDLLSIVLRRAPRPLALGAWIAVLGLGAWGFGPKVYENVHTLWTASVPALPTRMPGHLRYLVDLLKRHTQPGERLLFEDCNKGVHLGDRKLDDPFGPYRLAPMLPLETGLEVIGGPYLYTHQKTNFSQFGDGRFLEVDGIDAERFAEFAKWYDLTWIVCWSPRAWKFCLDHPELVEVVERQGRTPHGFLVGRIRRQGDPTVLGAAKVRAEAGRIHVSDARAEDGVLVLRYHWTPLLCADPAVEIGKYPIPEDPVPLIRIDNPPAEFTIRLDPWSLAKTHPADE